MAQTSDSEFLTLIEPFTHPEKSDVQLYRYTVRRRSEREPLLTGYAADVSEATETVRSFLAQLSRQQLRAA